MEMWTRKVVTAAKLEIKWTKNKCGFLSLKAKTLVKQVPPENIVN